jgi:hypothetical protein
MLVSSNLKQKRQIQTKKEKGATEFSIQDNNGYLLTFAEDEK